jgi:magnesium-transporting ATPase (P-type)
MDYLNENNFEKEGMDEGTKNNFCSLAQVINIASILGFVSIAITLITLVFGLNSMSEYGMGAAYNSQVFINIAVLIFSLILNFMLFNAAKNIKLGTDNDDQGSFNVGLLKLASYYKVIGILLVVVIGLVAIILVFGTLFGAASMFK